MIQERKPAALAKSGNSNLLKSQDKSKGGLPKPEKVKRVGRKPLAASAKASNKVLLSLTDAEMKQIADAAGMIPVATYIKNALYNGEQLLEK